MKKILFSRQYPKTKLALLTIIITIGYHYVNKESKRQRVDKTSSPKYSNEETQEKKAENKQSNTYDYNDFEKEPDPESPNELGFDKDAKLIHPSWVLEYLRDIRGRNPPIHIPRAPKALVLENRNNVLSLNDLIDVESLKKLWNLVRSDGFFYDIYAGIREYFGVGDQNIVMYGLKLIAKTVGEQICNIVKDAGIDLKNTLLGKFNELGNMIGGGCSNATQAIKGVFTGAMNYWRNLKGGKNEASTSSNQNTNDSTSQNNEAGLWQKAKEMPRNAVNGIFKSCSGFYYKITGKKNETVSKEEPSTQQTENTPTDNMPIDNMPAVNATTNNLPIDNIPFDNSPIDIVQTENAPTVNNQTENLTSDNVQTNVVDPWYIRTYKWCKKQLFGESKPERLPTIVEEEEVSSYHTAVDSSDVEFYSAEDNLNEQVQ